MYAGVQLLQTAWLQGLLSDYSMDCVCSSPRKRFHNSYGTSFLATIQLLGPACISPVAVDSPTSRFLKSM